MTIAEITKANYQNGIRVLYYGIDDRNKNYINNVSKREETMGTFIIILLISVALLGGALYFGQQRANRLIAEGKMIKRDGEFWNFAEIFTLAGVDYERVLSAVKSTDFSEYKVDMYPNNGGRSEVLFKSGHGWNAKLTYTGETEGKFKYRFEFVAWNTYRGLPLRADTMNMMETRIEKMFLGLDSQTTVETVENKLETKRSLF